jgi:hypothetical protein
MKKLARTRRGVTVSVDPQTHAQISELAASYSKEWGKVVSRTDIVRMGLTAMCWLRSRGKVDKPS